MRTIIAGSRNITDVFFVVSLLNDYDRTVRPISTVLSGGARGVDFIGESWAQRVGRPIERYPADWNRHGKVAGPIRNRVMLERAEACLVIWDGRSRGSLDMATIAADRIPTRLYRIGLDVDPQTGLLYSRIIDFRDWTGKPRTEQLTAIAKRL